MPTALHIAGLPSQPHPGLGARLVRRLGGAVRSVIVRAITLAGTLRRPATKNTSHHHTAAQHPQAPATSPVPVPHPLRTPSTSTSSALRAWAAKQTKAPAKRAGEGAAPLPPPTLAHVLARRHRRPAATDRPAYLNQGDKPFTPEACPQFGPKASAVLNTPLQDCDPKSLEPLVSAFTQHINQVMSPAAGTTDPAAAFPNLRHRLNAAPGDTNNDSGFVHHAAARASHPCGRAAGCASRTAAIARAGADDRAHQPVGKARAALLAATAVRPAALSPPAAPRSPLPHRGPRPTSLPVRTCRARKPEFVHSGQSFRYHTQSFA